MKIYSVLFSFCFLMSACGLGAHSRMSAEAFSTPSHSAYIHNLRSDIFTKTNQEYMGTSVQVLAVVEIESLPESLRKLPDGSEIGTLSVEFEDEIYQEQYRGEVKSISQKRILITNARVFLIRRNPENLVQIAFRITPETPAIGAQSTQVTVQSQPRSYCYQVEFKGVPRFYTIEIKAQLATCGSNGACSVILNNGDNTSLFCFYLNAPEFKSKLGACRTYQEVFDQTETRSNLSTPWLGVVKLDSSLVKDAATIEFEL